MDLVENKLWIGGLSAALDVKLLQNHGIKHIVTIDIKPLPPNGDVDHLFVPAHDVPGQDLLTCFPSVCEFIEKGMETGGVLVHCFHGVSRSAALVISYLQKKYNISTEESLARIQCVRPSVLPNEGFMAQLRLYGLLLELEKMDSVVMQWYNLQRLTQQTDCQSLTEKPSGQSSLKCKTCRHNLGYAANILYHKPGQEPDWKDLSWVRYALSADKSGSCRSAYFVIPPKWMKNNSAPQGKLLCPKCRSKIGAFSWNQSLKCPCSASFRPAFYFTPSRVDFIVVNT